MNPFATLTSKLICAGILLAAVAASVWGINHHLDSIYKRGVADGRAQVIAEDAATSARAQADHQAKAQAAAAIANQFHVDLNAALPTIEVNTHDDVAKVRTIYLSQPADAVVCQRPAGVQATLDAARERANAAARGQLRPDPASGAGP